MRKLAIAAAVSSSLATFSVNSLALGLGDIEMYSVLNQALDAEINILSAAPGELGTVQVRLAPTAAFASAGLERTPLVSSMKFNVETRPDGSPIIKVTSDAPVVEPFLNFLVEIDSEVSGRQVREFTVLLDPPSFATQQNQLPEATFAESKEVNIEEVIGASSPIIRSDIVVDEIEVASDGTAAVEIDEGEYVDLSQDIETSNEIFESVDLSVADSAVVSIDEIDNAVVDTSDLTAESQAVSSQGDVFSTSGDTQQLASVEPALVPSEEADRGVLIPLDSAVLNNGVAPQVDEQTLASDSDVVGEIVPLDDLNANGDPIFENSANTSVVTGSAQDDVLDQGARVDLTDLLPIEIVTDAAAPVDDAGVLTQGATDGVVIDLDSLATGSEPIEPVAVVDSASSVPVPAAEGEVIPLEGLEPAARNVLEPVEATAETVDLSGLEVTDSTVEAEVIVDNEEFFTDTSAAPAPLVDAVASEENEGVAIDLTGVLPADPESSVFASTGDSYTVNSQDTLWSIAKDNKPAGLTTQQMMVALLEANPGAFANGDMNQMRVGSVLNIPNEVAALSIGRADALAIVQEQIGFQRAGQQLEVDAETDTGVDADANEDISDLPLAEIADPESTASESDSGTGESPGLSIVGVDETANGSATPATDDLNSGADLSRDLDDVNRRVQLAQEDLASEAMQRDELQGRVDDLASSMDKVKRLITLRESELNNLQTELTTDADDTSDSVTEEAGASDSDDAIAVEDGSTESGPSDLAELSSEETQTRIKEQQEKISDEASLAQDRVAAQADADKNLAAAEAEAQRIRLANEEDELKLQLATLRAEKAELEKTAQSEKAELIRAAEEEKTALLEQAQLEKERITARLEEDKARISAEAEEEKLAIAANAAAENERLIAEANAERDRLAAESDAMREQLQALEQEKNQLMAQAELDKQQLQESADENLRLQAEAEAERQRAEDQARVKERLAQEQAKAAANLASVEGPDTPNPGNQNQGDQNIVERTDSSAETSPAAVDDTDATGIATTDNDAADVATSKSNTLVGRITDATESFAGGGTAAAGALGGLVAYAPLQRIVGDRAKTLAAGGGIALLGLIGSWAWRRRTKVVKKEDINIGGGRSGDYQRSDPTMRSAEGSLARNAPPAAAVAAAGGAAAATAATAVARGASTEDYVDNRSVDDIMPDARSADDSQSRNAVAPVEAPRIASGVQDDTLTEAEVYLRYGLHGQAEELLVAAVERDPDNQDYHVKLLENYHDQKNTKGFRSAATQFQDHFGASAQWEQIAQMGRELDPGDSLYSRASAMDISSAATGTVAGVAAAGAAAVGGVSSNDSQAELSVQETANNFGSSSDMDELADDFLKTESEDLDDTLDPGAEFDLSELDATGQFGSGSGESEPTSLEDVTLDEIDLAALDDDGTLNLEEVAGEEMSGLDLGALDFGDVDGDSSLDNLTLDDADLNSLDDMTTSLRGGLESDLSADDMDAGLNSRVDEMETMLDLAKAYIDMGDNSSAIGPLKDIAANGSPAQQSEATELLRKIT